MSSLKSDRFNSTKPEDPNRKSSFINLLNKWNKKSNKSLKKIKLNFQNNSIKKHNRTHKKFGISFINSINATSLETEPILKEKWSKSLGSENYIKPKKLSVILQNWDVQWETLFFLFWGNSLVLTTLGVTFQPRQYLWFKKRWKSMSNLNQDLKFLFVIWSRIKFHILKQLILLH